MRNLGNKIKHLLARIMSILPTPLPVGVTEFNIWADSIIALSGKYADEDSLKFALCSMIMHADSKYGSLPKSYFVTRLRKVAANQVAGQVFTYIKTKQQAAQTAAATQSEAAETAPKETQTQSVRL